MRTGGLVSVTKESPPRSRVEYPSPIDDSFDPSPIDQSYEDDPEAGIFWGPKAAERNDDPLVEAVVRLAERATLI
jgi:hypothetical protein